MIPKFLIHIIGLNRSEFTARCLGSVLDAGGDFQLVLTNNGSMDGTLAYFRDVTKRYPDKVLSIIDNTSNEGFIAPNNLAFEKAVQRRIPYYIALNNDTEVPTGWLDLLAAPLDRDASAALSGSHGTCSCLHNNMHGYSGGNYEYVEGSCLCAKVAIVSKYGPLFSDYLDFIYGDDSDLSLRMREKGHTIHRVPFTLKHSQGSTVEHSPEVKARCQKAQEHNHVVLQKRWGHYLKVRRFDYSIVLRRAYALGDVLLTTPVIRAIKEAYPLSPILIETNSPDIFKNNPDVCAAAVKVPLNNSDLFINLDMAYENVKETHIIDAYTEVVKEKLPGLGKVDPIVSLYPSDQDMEWARNLAVRNQFSDKVCVMHADGSDWPGKTWPQDRFSKVATWLVRNGWHVVTVGSRALPRDFDAFKLNGKTTMLQLAALLKQSHLFIGMDSFPMHVALAMGCPTVGIFGVTSSRFIIHGHGLKIALDAPDSIPCSGLRHRKLAVTRIDCDPACILIHSVEAVKLAVQELVLEEQKLEVG